MTKSTPEAPNLISRRNFLTLGKLPSAKVAGNIIDHTTHIGSILIGVAVSTPHAEPTSSATNSIYHGSLENRAIEKGASMFINPLDKGHFALLKTAVFSDEILFSITKNLFSKARQYEHQGKKLELGDIYLSTYNQALEQIRKRPDILAQDANEHLEAVHRTVYTVAAFATPWFTNDEYKALGVVPENTPPGDNIGKKWLHEGGLGRNTFPILYGDKDAQDVADGEPFKRGEDRFMHFANHVLLSFLYCYLNDAKNPHPLAGAIPWGIKARLEFGKTVGAFKTTEEEAQALSSLIGWGYEVKGSVWPIEENLWPTIKAVWSYLPGTQPYIAREGLIDPYRDQDIRANALGAQGGVFLYNSSEINDVIIFRDITNHKKYQTPDGPDLLTA